MLITHDLGVVAEMVDNVIVMYAGQVVEQGTVDEVLRRPADAVHDGPDRVDPDRGEARRPAVGDPAAWCRSRSTCRRPAGSSPAARIAGRPAARCRPSCTRRAPAAASPAATSTSRRRAPAVSAAIAQHEQNMRTRPPAGPARPTGSETNDSPADSTPARHPSPSRGSTTASAAVRPRASATGGRS